MEGEVHFFISSVTVTMRLRKSVFDSEYTVKSLCLDKFKTSKCLCLMCKYSQSKCELIVLPVKLNGTCAYTDTCSCVQSLGDPGDKYLA